MRGWLVMTAGPRCSSTKTPWPAAAATSEDHPDTPAAASNLAVSLRADGEYQAARELDEDTLARRRRVLGEDHPDTLASADGLAVSLRAVGGHPSALTSVSSLASSATGPEHQAARELGEDTLARRRRVLGEDHPDTLASASGLAISLGAVGEREAARELDEDTLARRRRVLGEDHPDTLTSADNLAFSLQGVRGQAARELAEDTLARRRRVLGEDHPDTLAAAFVLVGALTGLGEYHAARELNDDIIARRRRLLGDEHPETMMAGAFDLILRGLDIGGESPWMAALREASKRRLQEARELNEDEPG
jgi:hypothetical protein